MAAIIAPSFSTVPNAAITVVTPEGQDEYEAFFVEQYAPTVRLLMSMGTTAEQAQDATQDAFVRLYTRWRRIRVHGSPEAWVRRVAINRARDLYRTDSRRELRESRSAARHEIAESPDAEVTSNSETRRLLLQLPRRQRTVAALFYVEDMSIATIADALGLSTGAVKFNLNRARKNLRDSLEAEDSP